MTTVYYTHDRMPTTDSLLMHYAAGALPPYESMLVAAYLALNARAQRQLATYEAQGGRMIEEAEPVHMTGDCLNNILAIIEPAGARAKPHPAASAVRHADCPLPDFMRRLLATHCPEQKLQWRRLQPGISRIDIKLCHTEPRSRSLSLLRVEAGRATPAHRHAGLEITLVLEGSYQDGDQHYHAGDMVILGQNSQVHSPNAGQDGCVCMILSEGAPLFQNPLLRWMNVFLPL